MKLTQGQVEVAAKLAEQGDIVVERMDTDYVRIGRDDEGYPLGVKWECWVLQDGTPLTERPQARSRAKTRA